MRLEGFLVVYTVGELSIRDEPRAQQFGNSDQAASVFASFYKGFGCTVPSTDPSSPLALQVVHVLGLLLLSVVLQYEVFVNATDESEE